MFVNKEVQKFLEILTFFNNTKFFEHELSLFTLCIFLDKFEPLLFSKFSSAHYLFMLFLLSQLRELDLIFIVSDHFEFAFLFDFLFQFLVLLIQKLDFIKFLNKS